MSVVALFATLSPPERVPQPQPVTAMQSAITPMKPMEQVLGSVASPEYFGAWRASIQLCRNQMVYPQ